MPTCAHSHTALALPCKLLAQHTRVGPCYKGNGSVSQSKEILRTLPSKWYRIRPYCFLGLLFCVTGSSGSCPCPPGQLLLQWQQRVQALLVKASPEPTPLAFPTCLGCCGTCLNWPMRKKVMGNFESAAKCCRNFKHRNGQGP